MKSLPRTMLQKRLLVGFMVLLAALGLAQRVEAVSPSDYIGSNTIFYTVSAGSNSGSGGGATNLLYAPDTYLIAYYGAQDGNKLELPHGGFCSTQDSRARNAKLIVYGYSTVSEKKNGSQFYNYERIRDGTRRTLGEITAESCNSTYSFNIPSDWLAQSNVPNHVSSQFGTPLYPMIVRVRIAYDGNNSNPVNTGEGPLNTFKVNAPGGYIGAWTLDPDKWRNQNFTGGSDGQTVLLGRPSNMNTQDYTIPLTPPCTLFADNNEHDVWVHWYDDDQGTNYQIPDITMFLTTIKPDGTRTERQLGAADGLRFGGEAGFGRVKIKVRKGYKYVWKWKDVTNKNGVRAWLPFNTTENYFDCDASYPLRGTCDITIDNPSTKVVAPGQSITGTITVSNTGSNSWSVLYPSAAGTASFRLGVVGDSDRWGPGTKRLAIQPSVTGAFGPILESGKTTNTSVTFTAPATMSETETLTYRLLLEGDGVARTPYASCEVTFKSKANRPYLSVSGGDVYSGAMFGTSGVCDPTTTAAGSADIDTNGYYGGNSGTSLPGSSNSQYAVFASGHIGQNGATNNTFRGNYAYSRPHTANPSLGSPDYLDDALFANLNVGTYPGNFYQGQTQPAVPCVPIQSDESVDSLDAANPDVSVRGFLTSLGSGTRKITTDNVTIDDLTIPNGSRKTLLVDGDVTVAGNVTYDTSARTVDNIPYLKIVVSGNIYIEGGVSQLDGQYVARPTGSDITQSGLVDTCSTTGGAGTWPATLSVGSCDANQLVVNGSLSARRILWKRTSGTLGLIPSVLDPSCPYAKLSPSDPGGGPALDGNNPQTFVDRYKLCAAERVDYSPEGYLTDLGGPSDSVPITTQELPPIY